MPQLLIKELWLQPSVQTSRRPKQRGEEKKRERARARGGNKKKEQAEKWKITKQKILTPPLTSKKRGRNDGTAATEKKNNLIFI